MRTIESVMEMAETMSEIHRERFQGGDPYRAFQDHSITCTERDFCDPFDGMLRYRRGRFFAFINTANGQTLERQRFTAAHELGHFAIEHHNYGVRNGTMLHASHTGFISNKDYEREADTFAAHFLMPSSEVIDHCKGSDQWGAEQIHSVSGAFGTSLTSSARRCQQVLLGDSLLIAWQGDRRHWVKGAGTWERHEHAIKVQHSHQLLPGSATLQAMQDPVGCKPFRIGASTLSYWARKVGFNHASNTVVIEYAIPRGRYGVLTLLRPDQS